VGLDLEGRPKVWRDEQRRKEGADVAVGVTELTNALSEIYCI